MDASDLAVVALVRAGDRDAFRVLVERHSRGVFRLAYRLTDDEQDAEDVVQETFLRAFRQIRRFESRSSFATWLYRITVNCSHDLLRQRPKAGSRQYLDDPDGAPAAASEDLEQALQQASPMLEKMLNSQRSPQLKKRALFVLSQSKSPKAKDIVTVIAKGSYKTGDALAGLYWVEGQSREVRAEIVNGLFVQGNAKALVEIARKETDPAMRKAIVECLSTMKSKEATDFLLEVINK